MHDNIPENPYDDRIHYLKPGMFDHRRLQPDGDHAV